MVYRNDLGADWRDVELAAWQSPLSKREHLKLFVHIPHSILRGSNELVIVQLR